MKDLKHNTNTSPKDVREINVHTIEISGVGEVPITPSEVFPISEVPVNLLDDRFKEIIKDYLRENLKVKIETREHEKAPSPFIDVLVVLELDGERISQNSDSIPIYK